MALPSVLAVVLGLCLTAYAAFAGTDFGAGILDLVCGRSEGDRAAITFAIGPVWEANHVWLILAITVLFAGFPTAFAAVGTGLLAPLTVALLAIVVRGAALGARPNAEVGTRGQRGLSALFGISSIVAPMAFGMAAGGVAQMSVARAASKVPWTSAFSVTTGLLAVALCAHLGVSFTVCRLARSGDAALAGRFARRGLWTGGALAALCVVSGAVAVWRTPVFAHRLEDAGLPFAAIALIAVVASVVALNAGRFALARRSAVMAASMVVWGWFAAQAPVLFGRRLTIDAAAASGPALTAVTIAFALVLIAVVPALWLLHAIVGRPLREVGS
jgi:cytochrome d ubiquinol oxidase subunit II